jgi:tetratricopeptide (TPR) repeat protein
MMTGRVVTPLVLLLAAGCAARSASIRLEPDLSRAAELVDSGCYTCLRDAVALYDKLRAAPGAAKERAAYPELERRLFEATLLLTLRAKEVGLPFEPWLVRAREIGGILPPALDAETAIEVADVAPQETSGLAPRALGASSFFARQVVPEMSTWRERVAATGLGPTTKEYLDLTLACADRTTASKIEPTPLETTTPLIRYRLATCGLNIKVDVGQLLSDDARWAEVAWYDGRRVLSQSQNLTLAIERFTIAASAFPESGAMLMSLAGAQLAANQLEPALVTYDAVIKLVPEHRRALLGRVLALTYLERHEEAIAAASRVIDLGTYELSDAYYWRAQNHYQIKDIENAWADIKMALTLSVSTNVHTLAGQIAYARKDLDTALTHFDRAWALDTANCNAAFYKGIVQSDLKAWRDAAPTFSSATSCFASAAASIRHSLEQLEVANESAAFKAGKAAEYRKNLETNERQAAVSAYNAAQAFVRNGQTGPALNYLDIALTHAATRDKAEALKKVLAPPRSR